MAMDGTVVEKLIVEWRADYSKLTQDIDKIKAELRAARTETKQVQDEFRSGGKAAEVFGNGLNSIIGKAARAAAAIFSVHKAVGYLKNSIQLAMDVVESDSLFETTMGRWADSTRKWADSMEHSLGVNAFEVRKNVGVWYTMTESMGLTEEQALNMSKSLVQLKYDLSSFYNIADERAESVIEGMITGITAPAKQIGVVLTDEVAKRELLAAGIIKQGQAVDSTTMMYGRYLALMKQTETAHGDMARTIDSPANQLRVMQAALRNASLEMGQAFLPIVQTVLPWLQYLASFIKIVANALASLFGGKGRSSKMGADQAEITTGLGGVKLGVAEGEEGWKKYGNTAEQALGKAKQGVKDLQAAIMGFDQIHKVEEKSTPGGALGPTTPDFGNINADIDSVLDGLDQWIDKTTEIDEKVQGFIKALTESPIGVFTQTVFDVFSDIYNDILKPLGSWLMENSEFTIGALEGILLGVLGFKVVGKIIGPDSPAALAVGVLIGLAGAIDGFIREQHRLAKLEDLADRFGDISVSLEQAQGWARDFFKTFESEMIDQALTKTAELRKNYQDWEKALGGIMSKLYVASVGLNLSDDDIEEIRKGIDQVIAEGEKIAKESGLAIPIVFANMHLPTELSAALFEGYDVLEKDFIRTGERLRKAFDDAIADGIISEEEFNVIRKLQIEYQQLLQKMADARSAAALEVIWGDKGMPLTPESFMNKLNASAEEAVRQYGALEDIAIDQIAMVNVIPNLSEDDKTKFNDLIKRNLQEQKLKVSLTNLEFATEDLDKAFGDVLSSFAESFERIKLKEIDVQHLDSFTGLAPLNKFRIEELEAMFGLDKIKDATRDNLNDYWKSLKPSGEQLMDIYRASEQAGRQMPEGVAAGLANFHSLGAVAGNADSLMFMLGRKMSESPEARELYEEAKRSGKKINEHYAAGMESGMALPGTVTAEMISSVLEELDSGSIELQTAMELLGLSLVDPKNQSKFKLAGKVSAETFMKSLKDYLGRNPLSVEFKTKIITDTVKAGEYYTQYAEGGLPEIGEFFVAREAGPELVGRMGSRTAVANNDQIVAGIESGVFRAVVSALGGGGMQKDSGNTYVIPVYVGGEKLYEVVFDRAKRESIRAGRPLMEGV